MRTTDLLRPYLEDDALRSTNFFNGRLLTAEDLRREQAVRREWERRLGDAMGDGVAFGLAVEPALVADGQPPAVTVSAGAAVNREGHLVFLRHDVEVSLREGTGAVEPATGPPSAFGACGPTQNTVYVANAGVYLLAVRPLRMREGTARVSGLGNAGAPCAADALVDGVQFRMLQVPLTPEELSWGNLLRNRVGARFLWTRDEVPVRDPFGPGASAGVTAYDTLRPEALAPCDVPLALVHYQGGRIAYVDGWAVRRTLAGTPARPGWLVPEQRRWNEGAAAILHFQAHLDALWTPFAPQVRLRDHVERLPPAGIVPLGGSGASAAFDQARLFDGVTTRGPAYLEGALVGALLERAAWHPPIELASGEVIWLYFVRENGRAHDTAGTRPYLLFTSGHVPYQADARWDLGKWDYANYALAGAPVE
jgi:hypothetical protein